MLRTSAAREMALAGEVKARRSREDPGHVPVLDGLRGLAIILVLLRHTTAEMEPVWAGDAFYRALFRTGWCGVDLFFVLSGFLITGILLDAKGRSGYFKNFYARRVLRIFPLYYGFLVGVMFVLPIVRPIHDGSFETLLKNQGWYWTYLTNYLGSFRGGAEVPLNTGHFWSLAVEEQFYMVWPLMIALTSRKALTQIAFGLIGFSLVVRLGLILIGIPDAAYMITPARLDGLAIGALLAIAARSEGGLARLVRPARWTAIGLGIGLAVLTIVRGGLEREDPIVLTLGFSALVIFFGALLTLTVASTATGPLGVFFNNPVMRMFGRYSYALYVFHYPLLLLLEGPYMRHGPLRGLPSHIPFQIVFTLVVTLITLGMALLSWNLYEKQFLKLKRFFPSRGATPALDAAPDGSAASAALSGAASEASSTGD